MIELQNLSKSYAAHKVLDGIKLTLKAGKVHGIVGENGAGKTTLFKCIAGLEAYEGSINSPHQPLKDQLGFLPTDPYFFSKITGREYLQLLCNARQLPQQDFDAKNIFDLPLHQYAATYSTGMKKKLALTAILLLPNEVFILDEPFNGVDIQSNMVITGIIQKLRSLGKTVLISSHIFSTLNDTCDVIYLLKKGQIVRQADRAGFAQLEAEMRAFTIGDRIERLELR
ncbi:MAG: ATP-binding cassette domain-containing protein [Saprospiraceae bacterium]|jgi:ABC-2 type transport system ATP-binding protein|nr:ATP-binding cassette domain-containing protein [Saprospiraceae bacterium]